MKTPPAVSPWWHQAGFVLILGVCRAALSAAEPASGVASAGNPASDRADAKIEDDRAGFTKMTPAEVKSALAQIDAQLAPIKELAEAAPTPRQKADINARYHALNRRLDALKKDFTRDRYDAFKVELSAEKDRIAAWTKDDFATKPEVNSTAQLTAADAATTAHQIADSHADANQVSNADTKAALTRLDADLDLLAIKIDAISDPTRKQELTLTLDNLKSRRADLGLEYRQAWYDALVSEVRAAWNRITN